MSAPAQAKPGTRRRLIVKTATITAAGTFLLTQTAGWVFSRVADQVATATTPELTIESSGPGTDALGIMVPRTPEQLSSVRLPDSGVYRWAVEQGGGASNRVVVEITVWGNRDRSIVVSGIRASDVECRQPPPWTEIRPVGGGDLGARGVAIDLSGTNHDGRPTTDPVTGEASFRFPLQVSRVEAERFVVLLSSDGECSSRLEVLYESGGQVKAQEVDDAGHPFRAISSAAAAAAMAWTKESGSDGLVPRPVTR